MLYVVCACEECLDSRGAGTGVAPPPENFTPLHPKRVPLGVERGKILPQSS